MQIFTVNITRVVWPHVSNVLDLRYFCEHNPLFYHLNLIPCHYWSWQRNIYFLVNIFVRHTFPMSKSSIKTKTVLTMTDMTQSTELQVLKRPKDGYGFEGLKCIEKDHWNTNTIQWGLFAVWCKETDIRHLQLIKWITLRESLSWGFICSFCVAQMYFKRTSDINRLYGKIWTSFNELSI